MSVHRFTGKRIVSFDDLEREMEAEEVASDVRDGFEFDETNVEHRVKAINGALSTIDFTPCTGSEFWSVYTYPAQRETFIEWATNAKATIDDIVASYPGSPRPKPRQLSPEDLAELDNDMPLGG